MMRYRDVRAAFNGKTIESAVVSDLNRRSPEWSDPEWVEIKFTDGSAVRIEPQGFEVEGVRITSVEIRSDDIAHWFSKGKTGR